MLTLLLLNILELTQNYIGIFFLSFLYFPSNDVGLFVKFLPHARHGPEYPVEPISWLICLLHHIPSLIAYILRENRDFVFIIIVQFMMSSNSRMRFGLQIVFVCLYIASSHYHHCAKLIWRYWTYKNACQIYFVEYVSEIKHILSVIHYTIYGAVWFQLTHLACDDWENIYFVLLSSSNRKCELLSIV